MARTKRKAMKMTGAYAEAQMVMGVRSDSDFEVKESEIPFSGNGLFSRVKIPRRVIFLRVDVEKIEEIPNIKNNPDNLDVSRMISLGNDKYAMVKDSCLAFKANDARGFYLVDGVRNNCKMILKDDMIFLVSTVDIEEGQEVFMEYGKHYWAMNKELIRSEIAEEREKFKKFKAAEDE